MKKAVVLIFLLIAAIIVPFNESAEGLTIPSDFVLMMDPEVDVAEVEEGGAQTMIAGHDELDILEVAASIDDGQPLTALDDSLLLTMTLKGNVVSNNEDVSYIFLLGFDNQETYVAFCNYSSIRSAFSCWVLNIETGTGFTTAQNPTVVTTAFSVKLRLASIGNPTSITSLKAISVDNTDPDQKYGDIAPDKLVKFTSPSQGATIWSDSGTYLFTGACHKSSDTFTNVEIDIDNSNTWTVATTSDSWNTWSYSVALSSGPHFIEVRGNAGGEYFEDSLSFTVGNPGNTLSALPPLHVGDRYVYETVTSQRLVGLDLTATSDMEINIEKLETVNGGGGSYECFKVRTVQSGSVVVGVFNMEQSLERDSWRIAEDTGTQQTIIKEYTHTQQALVKSGSAVNSAHTFTNLTYDTPFDPGYLDKSIGDWWVATASGSQSSRAVDAEGNEEIKSSSPTKNIYSEVLRTEILSASMIPALDSSEECFIIKGSNGDNETSYTEYAYSDEHPVPLRIEAYDGNRELIGALVLTEREIGPGTYFEIVSYSDIPDTFEEGVAVNIDVTVVNKGDSAGTTWVRLVVDDVEKANKTSGEIDAGAEAVIKLTWTPTAADEGPHEAHLASPNDAEVFTDGISVVAAETTPPTLWIVLILGAVVAIVLGIAISRRGNNKLLEEHDARMAESSAPAPVAPITSEVVIEAGDAPATTAVAVKPAGELTRTDEDRLKEVIGEKTPVQCPKCSSTTSVVIDAKPYKFKCPECGAKLLLR